MEEIFTGTDPKIKPPKTIWYNLSSARLVEMALSRGEGKLSNTGALVVKTKKWTGRSPNDRFIVKDDISTDDVDWGKVNIPIDEKDYAALKKDFFDNMSSNHKSEIFVMDGWAGAKSLDDKKYPVRIITKLASHSLFARTMFWPATDEEAITFNERKDLVTVINDPDFFAEPKKYNIRSETAIVLSFKDRLCLVGASLYNGEIKKSIFSFLNYIYPKERNVFPMHCSCNEDPKTKESALFFGLSGTGKTTLSADENRLLIGDDEHGWSDDGRAFNFEAGCFAKLINISEKTEPIIYNAVRFGAIVENVVMDDETREIDYTNDRITENTRCAYPLASVPNVKQDTVTERPPKAIIFLCADAFGVMPPVARLDRNAARYHFATGYTAKLAGTERGLTEPTATFSACFGAPFMPLAPIKYADMLMEKVEKFGSKIYLVNTGWSGGPATGDNKGARMKLRWTRAMVTACLNDSFYKHGVKWARDPIFNVDVPQTIPESDVPPEIMNPRNTWANKTAFDETANKLAGLFEANAAKLKLPSDVLAAGPHPKK
ncbi:MAG: phosphoenolpyruvate carboxykinase (ATP) [Candidatus Thermoplasmatota archaeon]|nr:phosphoenolpyruvate carboxykinase (ATP) [Candidatus Thermoplasmatota archaeon]